MTYSYQPVMNISLLIITSHAVDVTSDKDIGGSFSRQRIGVFQNDIVCVPDDYSQFIPEISQENNEIMIKVRE